MEDIRRNVNKKRKMINVKTLVSGSIWTSYATNL